METRMADLDALISSAQGGQLIANLAERFGLSQEQVKKAVDALAPALSVGLEKTVEKPEGLGKIVECLCAAHECCAHDHADAAHAPDAVDRGQTAVLSLFGSEDNTSQILRAAAQQTGISQDILSQLLPILASVLFGGLNKSMGQGGMGGIVGQVLEQLMRGGASSGQPAPRSGGGLGDILGQVIAGGQGSPRGGSGGGLGDILGQVIAGGQGNPRSGSGGGLGDILGQVLGGGQQAPRGGGGGLGDILGQVIAGGPQPPQRGGPASGGGGLGEIFGKVLGELARGGGGLPGGLGRSPAGGGQDPRSRGGDPLETADASVSGGLDQASVQQAIDKIKQQLQINRGPASATGAGSAQSAQNEIEKVLGQIFGQRG
jgi:hypothetical protein